MFLAIHEIALDARHAVLPAGRLMMSLESNASVIAFCVALGIAWVARASWRCGHRSLVRGADGAGHEVRPDPEGASNDVAQRGDAGGGIEPVGALGELEVLVEAGPEVDLLEDVLARHAVEADDAEGEGSEGVDAVAEVGVAPFAAEDDELAIEGLEDAAETILMATRVSVATASMGTAPASADSRARASTRGRESSGGIGR